MNVSPRKRLSARHSSAAFSLVELLVVIAVIAVLMGAVAIPASGLMQARGVSGAVEGASSLVVAARIEAMKKGRPVRVIVDADSSGKETCHRRMAVLKKNDSDQWELASQMVNLPTGIFFWPEYSSGFKQDMKFDFTRRGSPQNGSEGGSVSYVEFDGRGQLADQARMIFVAGTAGSGGQIEVPPAREAGRMGFILRKSGRVTHYRSPDEIQK